LRRPEKAVECPLLPLNPGLGSQKAGVLKLSGLTVCFSHKCPAPERWEGFPVLPETFRQFKELFLELEQVSGKPLRLFDKFCLVSQNLIF
jgi:hypothetical protein